MLELISEKECNVISGGGVCACKLTGRRGQLVLPATEVSFGGGSYQFSLKSNSQKDCEHLCYEEAEKLFEGMDVKTVDFEYSDEL